MKTTLKKTLLIVIIMYGLFGFFVLPYIIKTKGIEVLNEHLNAKMSIESVSFNPFSFQLNLKDARLTEDKKEIVSFEKLSINFELYSLLFGNIHFKKIILESPKVTVVYSKNKELNLLHLFKTTDKTPKNKEKTSSPRILIDKIAIDGAVVHYEDYTQNEPYKLSFEDLNIHINKIDTADSSTENKQKAYFVFKTMLDDGGYIKIVNTVRSFSPFITDGSIEFESSQLYTQWRYLQDKLNIEVADGRVSFQGDYHLDLDAIKDMKLDNMSLSVKRLRIKPKEKNFDILKVKDLSVKGITAYPLRNKVHIENLFLDGVYTNIRRIDEKKLDWQEYIQYESGTNKTTSNTSTVKNQPFDLNIVHINVKDISSRFVDKYIRPNVVTTLDGFDLNATNFSTLEHKLMPYSLHLSINNGFTCDANGKVSIAAKTYVSSFTCQGLDVTKFNPYIEDAANKALKKFDIKLKEATLGFASTVQAKEINGTIDVETTNGLLTLDDLKINKYSTNERLFTLGRLNIEGVSANTKSSSIDINSSSLVSPIINTVLYKDKHLNLQNIVVAKSTKLPKKGKEKESWKLSLHNFFIQNGKLGFNDKTLLKPTVSSLDHINLHVKDINSEKRTTLSYNLNLKINGKGNIALQGKVRHTPLWQKGSIRITRLPLTFANPYLNEYSYVNMQKGYLDVKADESYISKKKTALMVKGGLKLVDLALDDERTDTTFFSLKSLNIPSYVVEDKPQKRVYIEKAVIDTPYVDAFISKEKSFNFATLSKKQKDSNDTQITKEDVNQTDSSKFAFKLNRIELKNGSAKFADFSLPFKFKTDIHDLKGEVYALSSQNADRSYVNIDGIVDKYGLAKIKGSLNTADPKLFTDIGVVFRNLDLSNLSPYSASFAGYKIDEGKLLLDLGYKIDNSKLDASNNVVISKIKLGDTIEDENITVLPLGLAIALLEDNDGIIDIDLPIKGDLNNPDFQYGTVVLKALGTLITKAITAPFSLLGSMLGIEGDKLESIDFEPGTAILLPPEKEKLDNLFTALQKRNKLFLNISGTYDEVSDKQALQKQKLIALIIKQNGISNEEDKKNVLTIDLLEDIYDELAKENKLDDIKKQLQQEFADKEQFKQKYLAKLIEIDSAFMAVTTNDLERLAANRAQQIENYLINEKKLAQTRVAIAKSRTIKEENGWIKTKLNLDVK